MDETSLGGPGKPYWRRPAGFTGEAWAKGVVWYGVGAGVGSDDRVVVGVLIVGVGMVGTGCGLGFEEE